MTMHPNKFRRKQGWTIPKDKRAALQAKLSRLEAQPSLVLKLPDGREMRVQRHDGGGVPTWRNEQGDVQVNVTDGVPQVVAGGEVLQSFTVEPGRVLNVPAELPAPAVGGAHRWLDKRTLRVVLAGRRVDLQRNVSPSGEPFWSDGTLRLTNVGGQWKLHDGAHVVQTFKVKCRDGCGKGGGTEQVRAAAAPPAAQPVTVSQQQWGEPQFITTAQLMADAQRLAAMLPADAAEIVGVARSGLAVASVVAMLRHLPLSVVRQSERDLVPAGSGWRMNRSKRAQGLSVIIDDTVMTGRSLAAAQGIVAQRRPQLLTAAVYSNPASPRPDLWVRDLEWPHLLEWNLFNSLFSQHMALDFDGILCEDCPPEADDDGLVYAQFLECAKPLYLARRVPVPLIVTARLEKYRAPTVDWLNRYGVKVQRLVMRDSVRQPPAEFKALHYGEFLRSHKPHGQFTRPLFVESDQRQAVRIAELSGGIVLCPAAGRCFTRSTA